MPHSTSESSVGAALVFVAATAVVTAAAIIVTMVVRAEGEVVAVIDLMLLPVGGLQRIVHLMEDFAGERMRVLVWVNHPRDVLEVLSCSVHVAHQLDAALDHALGRLRELVQDEGLVLFEAAPRVLRQILLRKSLGLLIDHALLLLRHGNVVFGTWLWLRLRDDDMRRRRDKLSHGRLPH